MQKPLYYHRKHRIMVLLAAMAALVSGGCSQTDEPDAGNTVATGDGAVAFGAYVSSTSASRASVLNIHSLKQSGFGVFALMTGTKDFPVNPTPGETNPTQSYMHNQRVEWKGFDNRDSAWVYEPEMFWPGTQKVSFFAYAPYTAQATPAITGWSAIDASGNPTLDFRLDPTPDKQIDLLYANAMNLINSPMVALNFKHALSHISFQITNGNDIDSNTTLNIGSLTFTSTDLGSAGTLDLATGTWSGFQDSPVSHTFTGTEAMKKGFFAIPPSDEVEMTITVNYSLVTIDSKLPSGSFKAENNVSSRFSIKLESGKSYCLNLTLSMHALEVNANISDWEDENHTWESDQSHNNKLEEDNDEQHD